MPIRFLLNRIHSKINRRSLHSTPSLYHKAIEKGGKLSVTFITPDNEEILVHCKENSNLLDVAHANDIELEGACEGSLACSTCHLIIRDQSLYDKLGEPSDEENDMLDLAFGLTET
jgi:ferredoxin